MAKRQTSQFNTRQYMLSEDYEVFYYSDTHFRSVGSHSHGYYELYFFEAGAVTMEIDGRGYPLKTGDVILIPPGVSHRALLTDPEPQTDAILENGVVHGVKAQDVQKILNLKHAWEFILDKDVLRSETNYYVLSHIARMVNEGFYTNGGTIRSVPVTIGGTSYAPPLPQEIDVREKIEEILSSENDVIDKTIALCLFCMKTQIFIDGNKRASIIFANHYLIQNGEGLLVVPESEVEQFKSLLIRYYEGRDEERIKQFLKDKCWRRF